MASQGAVERIVGLIRDTSSALPDDAVKALRRALRREAPGSGAAAILKTILENVSLARRNGTPMCQDTGTLTFFVDERLRRAVSPKVLSAAVEKATALGFLRRNTIDSVNGASIDTNVCEGSPVVHYLAAGTVPGAVDGEPAVTLLMKGGGSENMSRQYSLPDASLGAGRDLEGVRKCVLDACFRAQGFGCAPGILGVCVGGDRATGFEEAKLQLLRPIGARRAAKGAAAANTVPPDFERRLLEECNSLGIGPMGLGGKTTLLDVHVGARPRLPASFFVTVAYLCWAARRRTLAWK